MTTSAISNKVKMPVEADTNNSHRPEILDHRDNFKSAPKGSPYWYTAQLGIRMYNTLNSLEFKHILMGSDSIYGFHPKGQEPAPIIKPSLVSRSVYFKTPNSGEGKDFEKPTPITLPQGSSIISKPVNRGVLVSFRHDKLDSEIMGSETERGLQREVESLLNDVDPILISAMIKAIRDNQDSKHPLTLSIPSTGYAPRKPLSLLFVVRHS